MSPNTVHLENGDFFVKDAVLPVVDNKLGGLEDDERFHSVSTHVRWISRPAS